MTRALSWSGALGSDEGGEAAHGGFLGFEEEWCGGWQRLISHPRMATLCYHYCKYQCIPRGTIRSLFFGQLLLRSTNKKETLLRCPAATGEAEAGLSLVLPATSSALVPGGFG